MKKLAIFDFDGTLFDSIWDVMVCLNKALTIYDLPTMTREEYIPCLGGNIDDIVSRVLGENNTPENLDAFKKTYLDLYNASKKELTIPFPKALDVLEKLQENGILLAINSNRLNYSLHELVELHFPDIDFVLIEGHDIDYPSKPHPCGVNRIIKKAGVDLSESLYVGDSSTDIKTAENAGIDCVIVKWGYGNQNDFENDYILDCIDEMPQILKHFIG